MKITAIICEYNPFHNGHLYQLERAKEETGGEIFIAVMSGNFVQRGDMALFPKYERAKIAIKAGFDIVVELPTIYAINNAERFGYGAINLLKPLPDITISFGSEEGDVEKLKNIADFTETDSFSIELKNELSTGISYPVAYNNVLKKLKNCDILDGSNNILALEYIKNINKLNADISLHTVKRVQNYNSKFESNGFLSATAIRNLFTEDVNQVKEFMPKYSFDYLKNYVDNSNRLHDFILYKAFDVDNRSLADIFDISEGLDNRIKKSIQSARNYEEFIDNLSAKRYSSSRLSRIMLNLLLDVTKQDMLNANDARYMNVLAIKKEKVDILGYLNKYTKVVTKYTDSIKLDPNGKALYELDRKAEKLYSLINGQTENFNMFIV